MADKNFFEKNRNLIIIIVIVILAIIIGKLFSPKLAVWFGTLGTFFKSIFNKDDKDVAKHAAEIKVLDDRIDVVDGKIQNTEKQLTKLDTKETVVREQIKAVKESVKKEVDSMSTEDLLKYANENM